MPQDNNQNKDFQPIIVKHCFITVVSKIISSTIGLALISIIAFFSSAALRETELSNFVPYLFFAYILLAALLTIRLLYVFDNWNRTYYRITKKAITYHRKNFIFNRSRAYKIEQAVTVVSRRGIIGRIMNCGTVKITDPTVKDPIYLRNVKNPKYLREIIEDSIIRSGESGGDIIMAR